MVIEAPVSIVKDEVEAVGDAERHESGFKGQELETAGH